MRNLDLLKAPYEGEPTKESLHVIEPITLTFLLPKILVKKMMRSRSSFGKI